MQQSKKKCEYIRLAADLQSDSIVDGPGLRTVIWTQGCSHHCKGCQNPQTWSFKGGGLVKVDDVLEAIDELECQTGITFSGGDPMFQVEACNRIAAYCKNKGYNIWVYTGFTYEELMKMSKKDKIYLEFLKYVDVLVDGPFILKERNLSLLFRGSSNQRLIDVPKSLKENKIVLFDESKYLEEDKLKRKKTYI